MWGWRARRTYRRSNAIATGATVFIVLATALILLFTNKYRSTYCAGHLPVDLDAETEQELIDQQMGLGRGYVLIQSRRWGAAR